MNKIIIEVGSTCVKIDRYNGNNIERLDEITIQFKKHYNENHHLMEDDIKELDKIKQEHPDYIYYESPIEKINSHKIIDSSTRYGYYILSF